jgi:hypothetical protein
MIAVRPVEFCNGVPSTYSAAIGQGLFTDGPSLDPTRPQVDIHIPHLGIAVIPAPIAAPSTERSIVGEVEVRVPEGHGRVRCLGIRLLFVCWCKICYDGDRPAEFDTLHQQELVIKGSCVLEEGSQRLVELKDNADDEDLYLC